MDREFFLLMSVTDENMSWYRDFNFRHLHVDVDSEEFKESNLMHGKSFFHKRLPEWSFRPA